MATERRRKALLAGPLDGLDSRDAMALANAIEAVRRKLESGSLDDDTRRAARARLASLAGHENAEVRVRVARTLHVLDLEASHDVLQRLLGDENGAVRDAARRAAHYREDLARSGLLGIYERGAREASLAAAFEAEFGPRAVRLALALVEHECALWIRKAKHELTKAIAPAIDHLAELEGEDAAFVKCQLERHEGILEGLGELTKEPPPFRRERLASIVDHAVAGVLSQAKFARLPKPIVAVPRGLEVDARQGRLVQVFANLIQNAYESYDGLKRAPRVAVRAHRKTGGRVVVTVRDQGCGMSPERQAQAVKPYATSKPYGTGFGLTLARRIVETEHCGTLALTSELGRGTIVTVTFPAQQRESS